VQAGEFDQLLNALYLVPDNACEYITSGKSYVLHNVKSHNSSNGVSIDYNEKKVNFSCSFRPFKGQKLVPGMYKNAERWANSTNGTPGLDVSGCGRGHNEIQGEFEIFEIEYDEKGKVISFAADFKMNSLRGAVRFNSNYPVDEYFLRMTDPSINFNSQNLFYVRKLNPNTGKKEDVISIDRTQIQATLDNDDLNLVIDDIEPTCRSSMKNEISFHFSDLSELITKNSFIIQNTFYSENSAVRDNSYSENFSVRDYSNSDEVWESQYFHQRNYEDNYTDEESQNRITVSPKSGPTISSRQGNFTITEFIFDFTNNKILSLAYPALVNTQLKDKIVSFLPSFQFNHAILAIEFEEMIYWIDPTLTFQGGKFNSMSEETHGYALLIGKPGHSLVLMNCGTESKTVSLVTFDLIRLQEKGYYWNYFFIMVII
jgi:hypothetical protein